MISDETRMMSDETGSEIERRDEARTREGQDKDETRDETRDTTILDDRGRVHSGRVRVRVRVSLRGKG